MDPVLDEVGDMTPLMQSKVLCFKTNAFERVGGNETITSDVRIVAATNRDLQAMVAEPHLPGGPRPSPERVSHQLPPLANAWTTMPLLVEHFLARFTGELGKRYWLRFFVRDDGRADPLFLAGKLAANLRARSSRP